MAKTKSSVVGIDIGSQTIKVVEIRMAGKVPTITAIGMAETPAGSVDHMSITNHEAVGAVLKQLLANCGTSVNDVVISISGQASVLVRALEVPKMNDSELQQHMDWEITRNIPFAESTVVSDFKAFPADDPASQNMDVVMAIAPQSVVEAAVNMLKRNGKKAFAIDVEPLGIARLMQTTMGVETNNKTICVVEVGHKTTSINMYKNGKLLLPRQVPIGGEMFTRAISDNMGISFEEAEQRKLTQAALPATAMPSFEPFATGGADDTGAFAPYNPFAEDAPANPAEVPGYGDPALNPEAEDAGASLAPASSTGLNPDQEATFNAMAGVVDEFVSEVRRSVDYFRSKGGEVNNIYLCGGGAKLKGLDKFLGSSLGMEVSVVDPLKDITVNPKVPADQLLQENRQDFAVAVGTGLHIAY